MGAKIPRGVLLIGPPGTGKTQLARALANETNANFFYRSGSEFDEIFVGTGVKRIEKLFSQATRRQPSIIFIDEFDALAGKRNMDVSYLRAALNQLLTRMDGFNQNDEVIVIAATNLPETLDPAVTRAGRFDKVISIPYPNLESRKKILDYYISKVKYDKERIDKEKIVQLTVQFTGADLKNLINLAGFTAVNKGKELLDQSDLEEAFDRIVMGLSRRTMKISEEDKLKTAYHEAGHALVGLLASGADELHKVTILPRGQALGYINKGYQLSAVQRLGLHAQAEFGGQGPHGHGRPSSRGHFVWQ